MNLPCLIKRKVSPLLLNMLKKEHVYSSNDDLNNEDIALIARKFVFKKKNNGKDKNGKDFAKRNESENKSKSKIESKKIVKCFECSRYDHLRNEYYNFKINKGKALNVILNDEFDSENSNSSSDNKFAFCHFF